MQIIGPIGHNSFFRSAAFYHRNTLLGTCWLTTFVWKLPWKLSLSTQISHMIEHNGYFSTVSGYRIVLGSIRQLLSCQISNKNVQMLNNDTHWLQIPLQFCLKENLPMYSSYFQKRLFIPHVDLEHQFYNETTLVLRNVLLKSKTWTYPPKGNYKSSLSRALCTAFKRNYMHALQKWLKIHTFTLHLNIVH